jgi:hypothetical protein
MKPKKPLSDYTVAGLLFVAANADDEVTKSAILTELRGRQRVAAAKRAAVDRNRDERTRLKAELEIEGLRSKDEAERRQANRDLFAEMKDRAFEIVDIPEGLTPTEAVKQYNHDIHAKAKELYTTFKRANKKTVVRARRARVVKERRAYRTHQAARRKQKQLEIAARRHAVFPLLGVPVYYVDTASPERQIGIMRGVTYVRSSCLFRITVETAGGGVVKRSFSALEPVDNADRFNEIRAQYTEFERRARLAAQYRAMRVRLEVYRERLAALDAELAEETPPQSALRQNWTPPNDVDAPGRRYTAPIFM